MTEQSPAAATTPNAAAADATSGTSTQPAAAATPPAGATTPATPATPAATTVINGDGKPAEGAAAPKPGEPAKPGEAAKPGETPAGAPEKYELAAPEGMTLEPETTAQFETVARELNLTNDQANKLVPLAAALVQRSVDQQQAAHVTQVQKWLDESKADTEFGGDKFDTNVVAVRSAVARFATPQLKALMDQTGLGNHPEVVRLFYRIGNAIADDKFVAAPPAAPKKSTASVLFDHPTSHQGNQS